MLEISGTKGGGITEKCKKISETFQNFSNTFRSFLNISELSHNILDLTKTHCRKIYRRLLEDLQNEQPSLAICTPIFLDL